ncbi:transposase [Pseudomonas syringae]|nr:transposase [Pseudomonas syringae]
MEAERFKTSPDIRDEAIVLTVQELNWMLDGFDLWRNRPHQVLTQDSSPDGYNPGMISMSDDLPDDPVLLRQILLAERRAQHSQILDLK